MVLLLYSLFSTKTLKHVVLVEKIYHMEMGNVIKPMLFTHYCLLYLIDSQNCPSLSLRALEKQTQTTCSALGSLLELGVCVF